MFRLFELQIYYNSGDYSIVFGGERGAGSGGQGKHRAPSTKYRARAGSNSV